MSVGRALFSKLSRNLNAWWTRAVWCVRVGILLEAVVRLWSVPMALNGDCVLYLSREGLEALEGGSGALKSKHGREWERGEWGEDGESGDGKKRKEEKRGKRDSKKKKRKEGQVRDENK